MSIPNGPMILAIGAIMTLGACQAPTQVIGRNNQKPVVRADKNVARPAQTVQRPQILVKFKNRLQTAELSAFRSSFGLRNVSVIAALGVYVEEVTTDRPVSELLRELQASPLVEYAELNQEIRIEN